MRTLLIGALAASFGGCSCLLPPQASMEACTDTSGFACFDRTAASQPIELAPASFEANSAIIKVKSTITAKTEKPSSAYARDRPHLAMKTAKSTMIATIVEPPASGQPAETSDPVIIKTKTAIAAKLDDPASAELRANERATGSCYQLARAAGAICYDPSNGAVKRLDCQKARTTLRECFEHIPPGMSARSAPSETPAGTGLPSSSHGTDPANSGLTQAINTSAATQISASSTARDRNDPTKR
jgi:hypothetical protein